MNRFKTIGKIVLNIFTGIVVLAIILVLYNYIQIQCFRKKYSNLLGYTMLEVSTGSMADTLNIYDIIIVKITKDVKKDDIITFEQNEELITHRIIQIDEQNIITKGDANNTEDKNIILEQVVGKVIFVCPKLGIWIKVFSEPKVFISIIITIALIGKIFTKEKDKKEF